MDLSLFGKLSGELRNRIYEFALKDENAEAKSVDLEQGWFDCPFHRSKVMNSTRTGLVEPLEPLRLVGIPLTCKAMRYESLRLYYSLNRFTFETEYLKSKHKDRIIERLVEWAHRIGLEQAREIKDVTIGLASLKGTSMPLLIDWEHMRTVRSLFHPHSSVKIRFHLDGNGMATFELGSKASVLEQLDRMAEIWAWTFQRVRKWSAFEAGRVAEMYKQEVARLFKDMPDQV